MQLKSSIPLRPLHNTFIMMSLFNILTTYVCILMITITHTMHC